MTLTPAVRTRKEVLLRRGLSTHYAQLCFDAYDRNLISAGRLAEMMLVDERGLRDVGAAYGWSLKHGA